MIVVEGMDGTGKTSLADKLCERLNVPKHKKFASSLGGPPPDLMNLLYADVVSMDEQPFSVYDRHGLISEFVYGPIVRGTLPLGFDSTTTHRLIRMLAKRVLVVWCRPPFNVAHDNLKCAPNRDMPGVFNNAAALYHSYEGFRQYWPGDSISYDYTKPDSLGTVFNTCVLHKANYDMTKAGAL